MSSSAASIKKTISITGKRQITIPQKFFEALGFEREAECILQNNMIIIRPVRDVSGGEFAEQILADLIAQGISGEKLLAEFKRKQKQIRPAVEELLAEAAKAARGIGEFSTYDDIFGKEAK
jgi:bifunctional DNA-binding transcriptional regulator/antitoxin component of YhaV-PrlF toxin-antitoxin module